MHFCDNCGYEVMEIGFDDLYVCGKCYSCGQIKHSRVQNDKRGAIFRGADKIETNEYVGIIEEPDNE